jgi:hypothetical protein
MQEQDPIDRVVATLQQLTISWFPEPVILEETWAASQHTVDRFTTHAYFVLAKDVSIPLEHRKALGSMETQNALIDDINLITDAYVHVFVLYTEQEMEDVLMTNRQQLSVENMRDIVLAAYTKLLSRASGGASPARCSEQLLLAIPVRLRLCVRNHPSVTTLLYPADIRVYQISVFRHLPDT